MKSLLILMLCIVFACGATSAVFDTRIADASDVGVITGGAACCAQKDPATKCGSSCKDSPATYDTCTSTGSEAGVCRNDPVALGCGNCYNQESLCWTA
jgi:hypothetical protein